jgi:hypothetical protein
MASSEVSRGRDTSCVERLTLVDQPRPLVVTCSLTTVVWPVSFDALPQWMEAVVAKTLLCADLEEQREEARRHGPRPSGTSHCPTNLDCFLLRGAGLLGAGLLKRTRSSGRPRGGDSPNVSCAGLAGH